MNQQHTRFQRKLYGWVSYAFASEVYMIVSLGLFLPICLEQFARDNGFVTPEGGESCNSSNKEHSCFAKIGWLWVDTASFSLYVNSISVAFQVLVVISMGGIADHPPHRKKLLLIFAALGSICAMLFLVVPSTSSLWLLCAPLGILSNVGFGASVVAMNAYIPSLARESPEVIALRDLNHASSNADQDSASAPLLSSSENDMVNNKPYEEALSTAMSRISSLGIALGYCAGILLLMLTLIPAIRLKGSTFSLRLCIALSGIWWALFSIPAALWLPGGSLVQTAQDNPNKGWDISQEVIGAWKRLIDMLRLKEIKSLRNTFKYLAAWFLLSDGFTTMTATAVLFAKTVLQMPPFSIIIISVLAPLFGIMGSLAWPRLQHRFKWSNHRVLVILLILASLIPLYGCLGFLFTTKDEAGATGIKVKFGGLTTPGEMYVLAMYFGFMYGAFQSYARAFYGELLPPGEDARWYALFSITDKSSSFVGPFVVGVIAEKTGNIRYAFFFLLFMVWLSVPILIAVDVERGKEDARGYKQRYKHST